ncbi:MAG: FAD-dependent oxidoreductase [Candidatus Bilamarchaeaceae archaeon]
MARVIVVGGGPAGLFAAHELSGNGNEVILIEKGLGVEGRLKALARGGKEGGEAYICGMGGSGTFSDGKINLHAEIGGNMLEFVSPADAERLIAHVDSVLARHGAEGKAEISPEAKALAVKCAKAGIKFIPIRQKHVGSDKLPDVVLSLVKELERMGAEILTRTEAVDIAVHDGAVEGVKIRAPNGKEKTLPADYAILAPGRVGSRWLMDLAKRMGIGFRHGPLDIGVRIEVPNEVMQEFTSVSWDPKFHIRTKTHEDFIRTFCTNPSGFVITEHYGKFVSVNGHSMKEKQSGNTNFAFLVRIELTEPLEDTTLYGESICKLSYTIGGGKAVLQRLGDLQKGRRSTWERIERGHVVPTHRDVTPGDISMALPGRLVDDIREGLDALSRVIPGINDPSTLIYAPEVKFKSVRLDIAKSMETKAVRGLFTAGDGAGVSGGIVPAAVTGLIAAEEILRREGKKESAK